MEPEFPQAISGMRPHIVALTLHAMQAVQIELMPMHQSGKTKDVLQSNSLILPVKFEMQIR
jgi:hypothetical protein